MKKNEIYNMDCLDGMKLIPSESIDCILTDPPYLYLKKQRLDRPFDEDCFFYECKRVLKKDGFIVLFGRGTSFYRWNTILSNLGFTFKEEVIWDKSYCSSPLMAMSRVHETVSIHTKGNGTINKVKIPYIEMKGHDIDSICQDVKRMRSILNNTTSLNNVLAYLEDNKKFLDKDVVDKYNVSGQPRVKQIDRAASVVSSIKNGMNEKSIVRSDRYNNEKFCKTGVIASNQPKTGDRCCNAINSITRGMNEKSIIRELGNRYKAIHPTQKPIRLIERLLALTTTPGSTVVDPFSGSGSIAIACLNTNRYYIAFEIDKEFFDGANERLNKINVEPKFF